MVLSSPCLCATLGCEGLKIGEARLQCGGISSNCGATPGGGGGGLVKGGRGFAHPSKRLAGAHFAGEMVLGLVWA